MIYESYAYSVISDILTELDNPDSLQLYDVRFLEANIEIDMNFNGARDDEGIVDTENFPVCIIYYGSENYLGEINTAFALGAYLIDAETYVLIGSCESLVESDNISSWSIYHIRALINKCYNNGIISGSFDIERLRKLFTDDSSQLICNNIDCENIGFYSLIGLTDSLEYYCKSHYDETKEKMYNIVSTEIENLTSNFKKTTDKVTGYTTYSSHTQPYYADTRSYILPDIVYIESLSTYSLRLRCHFTGDSWLFFDRLTIYVDGKNYNKTFDYSDVNRDNDSGDVWEWVIFLPNSDEKVMLQEIADSTETIVRFHGDVYHYDLTVNAEDKQVIDDFLVLDNLMSKIYTDLNKQQDK